MDTDQNDRLTLQEQVCFTLSVASREVVSLYRPLLEPLGLTHPQYLVMITLWGADRPVSVKQLSRRLQLEAPTLSRSSSVWRTPAWWSGSATPPTSGRC